MRRTQSLLPRFCRVTRLTRLPPCRRPQSLQESTAQAAEQLLENGRAPEDDEAAAAMREATKHLELAREALARQRAAMEGVSEGLLQHRGSEALRLASLDAAVESETAPLVSSLSAKRVDLDLMLRGLSGAQAAHGPSTSDALGSAQRAVQGEAEAALALIKAQAAFAQAAAEAQRSGLAREEGQARVLSEGREMVAAGARDVAEALRTQAEVLLIAQRLQESDLGVGGQAIAEVADALQASLPLLGTPPSWFGINKLCRINNLCR